MSVLVLSEEDLRRILREELARVLAGAPRASSEDRRVTAAEAAAASGLASATVRAWAARGLIKRYGEGRAVRYSLAEVLAVRPAPRTSVESAEAWAERTRRSHG